MNCPICKKELEEYTFPVDNNIAGYCLEHGEWSDRSVLMD